MLTRWGVLLIGFAMAAQAAADEMSVEQARRFVTGELFAVSCFDGTRGVGRIYGDGSAIGTIKFRGAGPERSVRLPAGTLKDKGEKVCASLKGMPFEPCFNLNRTSDHSFRGSVLGLDTAYCDFTRRLDRDTDFTRAGGRNTDGPFGCTRALLASRSNAERDSVLGRN